MRGVNRAFLLTPPDERRRAIRPGSSTRRARGVRHLVKFSAMLADPASPARFIRWHGQVDRLIQSSGLAWTLLRPPFFMQNLLGLAGMVKGGTLYQPAADARAASLTCATSRRSRSRPDHRRPRGQGNEITGPRAISHHDIAAAFSKVLGRPVNYVNVPPEAAKQAMTGTGMAPWQADSVLELYALLAKDASTAQRPR